MIPTITIIGRPNVGKSTLFNVLTRSRDALVVDQPGVTRDRQYGLAQYDTAEGERQFWVIDTGGIAETDDEIMATLTEKQVDEAIKESDKIIFLVDAKEGLTTSDELIAKKLRPYLDKTTLVVNKADRVEAELAASEFFALGFKEPSVIAAAHKRGINQLVEHICEDFPEQEALDDAAGIPIAIIGRPNVGKSTLVNCMLGEERVIVLDRPGTTRDSIYIPFERRGQNYTLIDTAGVRRRSKIDDTIEQFSVIKTIQAIESAAVVLMVLDARETVSEQDLKLIGNVLHRGRALVILFNKWDGMDEYDKDQFKAMADRRLDFIPYIRRYFISALHGTNVGDIYRAIHEAYKASQFNLPTSELTKVLEQAVQRHQPPLVKGRRVKPRYAHVGGHNPLLIVVHGKQVQKLPGSYKKYLENFLRKKYDLIGIPIAVKFRNDENPYN